MRFNYILLSSIIVFLVSSCGVNQVKPRFEETNFNPLLTRVWFQSRSASISNNLENYKIISNDGFVSDINKVDNLFYSDILTTSNSWALSNGSSAISYYTFISAGNTAKMHYFIGDWATAVYIDQTDFSECDLTDDIIRTYLDGYGTYCDSTINGYGAFKNVKFYFLKQCQQRLSTIQFSCNINGTDTTLFLNEKIEAMEKNYMDKYGGTKNNLIPFLVSSTIFIFVVLFILFNKQKRSNS